MPGRELAGGIEAGAQVMRRQRPEAAVVHIVLARPHHLDRALDLLRQHHRVHDEIDVAVAAPAETAAHQQVVQLHLVARDAEELGRRFGSRGLALRPRPDFDRIAARRDRGDRVQRLHLRVIGIVAAILAFDHAGGASGMRRGHCLARSSRAPDCAGFFASAAKASWPFVAVEAPGNAGPGPGDRVRSAPGAQQTPPTRSAATTPTPCGSLITAVTPGYCLRLRVVDLVRDRSFDRARAAPLPYSMSGHLNVDSIRCRAVDLARQLDAHHVLADEAEVGRLLQLLGLDLRRLGRHLGKRRDVAIAQPAAGLGVHDHARLGGQFLDRHAELAARRCRAARGALARPICAAACSSSSPRSSRRCTSCRRSPDCRKSARSAAPARCAPATSRRRAPRR